MLAHGRSEILALAAASNVMPGPASNGWNTEIWDMDSADVDRAVAVYEAVLHGAASDPVTTLLARAGIDLGMLLVPVGKDDITRADLAELTAAASLVAVPGLPIDRMHMPNVPKMSRRKSESGVDIFVVELAEDLADVDLQPGEKLYIASVKHSIDEDSAYSLRYKLVSSLSEKELNTPYLATQLRVINGRLIEAGYSAASASRVYMFLREFRNSGRVSIYAIGFVDSDLAESMATEIENLPTVAGNANTFRTVLLPGLRTVHEKCP